MQYRLDEREHEGSCILVHRTRFNFDFMISISAIFQVGDFSSYLSLVICRTCGQLSLKSTFGMKNKSRGQQKAKFVEHIAQPASRINEH